MKRKKRYIIWVLFLSGVVWYYFSMPSQLFKVEYSTVINNHQGNLLGAKIANDSQWRFPPLDSIPQNFERAIICFEDKRFYDHRGIDFFALARAMRQNIRKKKIISGASTITMQVARMSKNNQKRTYFQKIKEIILATRIEFSFSKKEILSLYASHAPFGGNVVGLEAASWRYFKKSPFNLTIAESAMLAVLPNAPSLIHINKNRVQLLKKRNKLLKKMRDTGIISEELYTLSILESIPEKPYPLPREAPHLLDYCIKNKILSNHKTHIDPFIQSVCNQTADAYSNVYQQSDVQNISILVAETKSGKVRSYIGNASVATHEKHVDMVQAKRSSGSVLKPLLYAHSIDKGLLLPKMLIRDIPTQISGFQPKNYNRRYTGAISADAALAMSLNIPAVLELQTYGVAPFLNRLRKHGYQSLDKDADYYGLSLILGGGEITLWDLVQCYGRLGSTLIKYNDHQKYPSTESYNLKISGPERREEVLKETPELLSAGSIYTMLLAMKDLQRPGEDGRWQNFESSRDVSWKTGTSHGHKDAWAIGVTPEYTVGVWVGNADGEGKNGLVGYLKAAPVLFDIFNKLPRTTSFREPTDDLVPKKICSHSGYIASEFCENIDSTYIPYMSKNGPVCPYHRIIHLNNNGEQVTSECTSPSDMILHHWFVLPASMSTYYRVNHPEYKDLPSYHKDCVSSQNKEVISFIYPSSKLDIFIPKNIHGIREKVIFEAAHNDPSAVIHWHLDEQYLGSTTDVHTIEVAPKIGLHNIKIIDQRGNHKTQQFNVIN